jgi:hypothetical protein
MGEEEGIEDLFKCDQIDVQISCLMAGVSLECMVQMWVGMLIQ